MTQIVTATGLIDADQCGRTLMHEHLLINLAREFRGTGLINDHAIVAEELQAFVAAGGSTIVELTSAELSIGASADPGGYFGGVPDTGYSEHGTRTVNHVLSMEQLARQTGVNIVLGTGHYRDPHLGDGWIDRRSVRQVAERMIADLTEGFPGTSVRAGIIGEVGADKWYISALEERSIRAAAFAHRQTGVTITTHAARWPVGIPQLDLLAAEDVDPRRVIIGHCDGVNIPEYHLAIARRGAYVQFDTVRGGPAYGTNLRADFVVRLRDAGHLDRVLLSHDVCRKDHLRAEGGCGLTFIFEQFQDALMERGLSKEEVEQILVANPRQALAGQ
ncbi:MAG TPA: hypothetical protein VGH11_07075 [Jatrophihabitans sp.]|jgi:phosphotriesterase-related protein